MNLSKLASRTAVVLALTTAMGLAGCSQQDQQLDDESPHVLKHAEDQATDLDTNNNIKQINMALSMWKSDNGSAPATIDDAKKAAHVPDSMWTDSTTGKPLIYDPSTGTVHRPSATPDSGNGPVDLNLPAAAGG